MVKSFEQGSIVTYEKEDGTVESLLVVKEDEKTAGEKTVTYDYNKNPISLTEYTDYDGDPSDAVIHCVYLSQIQQFKSGDGYDLQRIKEHIDKSKLKPYFFHSERLSKR